MLAVIEAGNFPELASRMRLISHIAPAGRYVYRKALVKLARCGGQLVFGAWRIKVATRAIISIDKSDKRGNLMKTIIEKLSSYNIFNYLLPGTVFVGLGEKLTSFSLIQKNWIVGVFLYYFIGLIISRLGSLIVEPFLKWIKFVRFAGYEDYVKASKSDSMIEIFSEENNMYRTLCMLSIILIFLKIYDEIKDTFPWSANMNGYIFLAALLRTVFVFL